MKRTDIKLDKVANTYTDLNNTKTQIIKDNRQKSGIYMWTNNITSDIYVGSSINLGLRFKDYFNISHISNSVRSNSIIHRALLKYGYSNFQLEIIEYCDPTNCIEREQYYLDLFKPSYNILTKAGSSKGYKHSIETLENKIRPFLKLLNASKRLPVKILDVETNIETTYESITSSALALNTNEKNVRYAAKNNKLLLKKYKVTIQRKV